MNPFLSRLARLALLCWLVPFQSTAAPSPFRLLHSLSNPGKLYQEGGLQGGSVAIDEGTVVVGTRYDDTGDWASGIVRIYDARTGALRLSLQNPTPYVGDQFGLCVGISGPYVVAGAYWDDAGEENCGIAYVYDLRSAVPTTPVLTLTNPFPTLNGEFGADIAISGTRVVVGAPGYNASTAATNAGRAYVYDLASETPAVPQYILERAVPLAGNRFGSEVAMSGGRAVVTSYNGDTNVAELGTAYVYELESGTPLTPARTLVVPGPAGFWSGISVAIDAERLVLGTDYGLSGTYHCGPGTVFVHALTPGVPVMTITNPNAATAECIVFGSSVAISGSRLAVGAHSGGLSNSGVVYLYDLANASPATPHLIITNPTPKSWEAFGTTVLLSDPWLVVGDVFDDTRAFDAGSVYVYNLGGAEATSPIATLNDTSPASGDHFGSAVAASQQWVVVGSPYDDTDGTEVGMAYVYDLRSSTPWKPALTLTNPNPVRLAWFGYAVAVSGDRVAIGAPGNYLTRSEVVWVFDLASATPTLPVLSVTNRYIAGFPWSRTLFGAAVAIDGLRLVVGAPMEAGRGAAYLYDLGGADPRTPLAHYGDIFPYPNAEFGSAVAVSGQWVAVGSPKSPPRGTVSVFTPTNQSTAVMTVYGTSGQFGKSVALSGTRLVVGDPFSSLSASNAGRAFVYDLTNPAQPIATLSNPMPTTEDGFGASVAVSGTRVVVGASGKDNGATNAGSAYLYDLAGPAPLLPEAVLANPTPASDAHFGAVMALHGATLVIGAPDDNSEAIQRGKAAIFSTAPLLTISRAGSNMVRVAWTPTNAPGFVLQSAADPTSTNWVSASGGTVNPATFPATSPAQYYRLTQP